MIKSVMNKIGFKTVVYSPDGEKMGETFGRMRLYKSNARVVYNDRVTDAGVINDDTYIFVGSSDGGGKSICEEAVLTYGEHRYLVIKCDFSVLNGVGIVWAALKRLTGEVEV